MMRTLIYDHVTADHLGVIDYAANVMRRLGIEWEKMEPQAMADQTKFFGCKNVPEEFPDWARAIIREGN